MQSHIRIDIDNGIPAVNVLLHKLLSDLYLSRYNLQTINAKPMGMITKASMSTRHKHTNY